MTRISPLEKRSSQIGDRVHLFGAGVAGDAAAGLQRQHNGNEPGRAMGMAVRPHPKVENRIAAPLFRKHGRRIRGCIETWISEPRPDRFDNLRA